MCGEDGHGRPEVRGGRFDVSITWAGRWGIVALAEGRVGIDAELLRASPRPVTSALSAAETTALASLPERSRGEMFVRLWSAKEAVAKADGRGLSLPLAQLDAAPIVAEGRAVLAVDRTTWHVAVLDHRFPDRQAVAVAIATDRVIHDVVWCSEATS